jgi:serine/threonine protein kinase/Tfp pilus assembly protein PilF
MPSSQTSALNAALAGRYAIERELGRGGMATVYLADDLKHHRQVAIKVLRPELVTSIGSDRFLREIRTVARLNHPHILPLYDSGAAGEILYYVMPFVRGESLRQKLARERQLNVDEALTITRHVTSALSLAHGEGIIHRDIKPENILLHEGEAMLADFGIALALQGPAGTRLTETGLLLGTPEYMSPEQAAAEAALDARSDVYSLACVLYEMLAGESPHRGPTVQAMITKRLTDPPPAVRRVRGGVPAGVERALLTALATDPADRFPSAAAFGEALAGRDLTPPAAPTVAVLPFVNLSADPDNEYFADGITEDVIAQLAKLRSLKVISRTSVMRFKQREQSLSEIGASLGATTILEGSVRRAGDRVRIVAQLIDVAGDRHLWAETYDRRLTDIFLIQTDVALHIAAALRAELSRDERDRIRKEPTADFEAYQLYLRGRHWYTRFNAEGFTKSVEFFDRAVARDPDYAVAWAALAMAHTELGETGATRPDQAYPRARAAAARALALDPDLGGAHSVAAYVAFVTDFDWDGAEREFRRALELTPGNADIYELYGRLCSALERYDEAIALLRRAHELDPMVHRADLATAFLRAGRFEDALRTALHVIELDPHYARGHATLAWAYLKLGRHEEGLAHLQTAVALAPGDLLWVSQLGQAYALTGNQDKAREVLRELTRLAAERYVSPYHFAYLHTGLGEHNRAMDYLEQAYAARAGAVYGIKGSFLFTPLHGHPRFTALLRRMNLAP